MTFHQPCRDCGENMQVDIQQGYNGRPSLTIVTCMNRKCDLWSVTLTNDVYESLTEEQLANYRKSVADMKVRLASLGGV